MKNNINFHIQVTCNLFGRALCAGTILLILTSTKAQNLFEADYSTGTIYEFTPNGAQSLFASGLPGPAGLAFNSQGDLFVGTEDGVIIEIMPDGTQSTFASGLSAPVGVAFNSAGNLFVANYVGGDIVEITPNGTKSTFATGLIPNNVSVDSAGNVYVANGGNSGAGDIIKITPTGTKSIFASGFTIFPVFGLAFDSAGNLFVSDTGNNITKIAPNGTATHFVGVAEAAALAFNSAGNLFAANISTGQITEISPNGTQSIFASGLNEPQGLAFQTLPEPSASALMVIGTAAWLTCRHRKVFEQKRK